MQETIKPDYIFETSWEVCNLVGGIYTVLSTRAAVLRAEYKDEQLVFIGPDVWTECASPFFVESENPKLSKWKRFCEQRFGLSIRVGEWSIPGNPVAVLVNFSSLFEKKNEIFGKVWEKFGVNSIASCSEYDGCAMFGYAAGMVVESFYEFFKLENKNVIAHFNEWQTAFGIFYIKQHLPSVATVFTTHATTIGRSIAGNHKPLYDYFTSYNGDQMADELNVVSKHSVEKMAAHTADCFTTVSEITARECTQLLERKPDVVTPNGFEDDFVPKGKEFTKRRNESRKLLSSVAEKLLGYAPAKDALFVGTAGRYEYKNKGLDVLLESLKILSDKNPEREIIAFITIPAWVHQAREDLANSLKNGGKLESDNNITTHELVTPELDSIMQAIRWFNFQNTQDEKVKIVYIPSYLDGFDGILNKPYYDILIGMDLTVFASYYEPWGYTPLESIAFRVPTITTDLSGFGQWVMEQTGNVKIETGVAVVHRSDSNAHEATTKIAEIIYDFSQLSNEEVKKIHASARKLLELALWKNFIKHYYEAYSVALGKLKTHRLQIGASEEK